MAATAWTVYNNFRRQMADGTIDLDNDSFKLALFTSASNASASAAAITVISSVTNEISATGGYVAGGKALVNVTWNTGASAGVMRWDADDVVFTASGANLNNIKYAVIYRDGASATIDKLVCYSRLTTSQFTVSSGNTLTITFNANGIFELT